MIVYVIRLFLLKKGYYKMINKQLSVNLIGFSENLREYTSKDIAIWFFFIAICYASIIIVAERYDNVRKSSNIIYFRSILRYKVYYTRDVSLLLVLVMVINFIVSALLLQTFSVKMVYASILLILNFFLKASIVFFLLGFINSSITIGICFVLETSVFWHKGDSIVNVYNWGMLSRDQLYVDNEISIIFICIIEVILSVLIIHHRRVIH